MRVVWGFLILGLLLQLCGWILFGSGFFPMKTLLPGISKLEDQETWFNKDGKGLSRYDRTVFVVIDAFRADFVYSSTSKILFFKNNTMPFLYSLISAKKALPMVGKAQAPTVTLPRIKALISGSLPSFWDFVDNFHSPALKQDSLVHQFRQYGWKSCFYGDDTWLSLFPPSENFFLRYEGTTSFYVADTVEVDNNVTRNLHQEIRGANHLEPCDALVLHYLGLDHIGHSQGPRSPLLGPKLREMDNIIRQIYEYTSQQDQERCESLSNPCGTLIVVTGDHGMNELGNHGGSSPLEVDTGLFLIDNQWEVEVNTTVVNQVDLIPSISLLFGLPIPRNSLGKVISQVFARHSEGEILLALHANVNQLLRVIQGHDQFWESGKPKTQEIKDIWEEFDILQRATHSAFAPHAIADVNLAARDLIPRHERLLEQMSDQFIHFLTEYDTPKLFYGVFLLFFSSSVLIIALFLNTKAQSSQKEITPFHIFEIVIFILGFLLFLSSLFTSSLIEEEHQTWYFLVNTYLILYVIVCFRFRTMYKPRTVLFLCFVMLCLQRLMRSWNQTGDKWVHLPDIGDFIEDSQPILLITLCFLSASGVAIFAFLWVFLAPIWTKWHASLFCISTLFCSSVTFLNSVSHIDATLVSFLGKYYLNNAIQSSYYLLLVQAVFVLWMYGTQFYVKNPSSFMVFLRVPSLLLMMMLHKPRNQLLLIIMTIHSLFLHKFFVSVHHQMDRSLDNRHAYRVAVLTICFCKASYFMFGNSNSLASIDIGGAYTGLSGYNEWIVGFFSGIILYSGPIIYTLNMFSYAIFFPNGNKFILLVTLIWESWHTITMCVFTCVISLLRYHLFIWSVFSPKFLFESLHTSYYLLCSLIFVFLFITLQSKQKSA